MQAPSGARFVVRGLVTVAILFGLALMNYQPGAVHKNVQSLDSSYSGRGLLWLTRSLGDDLNPGDNQTTAPLESPLAFNENSSCSAALVRAAEDQCEFINTVEECSPEGFINYLALRYCNLSSQIWAFFVAISVLLIAYFYLLGGTAERFFCPSLSKISEALQMSPNVAGVTLLALGNGSPDIFSTIAAVSQGAFASSLGSQLGAGMFVTTVVVGAVAVAAGEVPATVTRRPFLRDVLFYVVALVAVFFVVSEKKIRLWQSLSFIGYYFFYVSVVVLGRYIYQRNKRARIERLRHLQAMNSADIVDLGPGSVDTSDLELLQDDDDDAPLDEMDEELLFASTGVGSLVPLDHRQDFSAVDTDADADPMLRAFSARSAVFAGLAPLSQLSRRNRKIARRMKKMVYLPKAGLWGDKKLMQASKGPRANVPAPTSAADSDHPVAWREPSHSEMLSSSRGVKRPKSCSALRAQWSAFVDFFDWPLMSTFERVMFILLFPRYLIQHLTIPWAAEGKYFRWFYVAHPISICAFCLTAFQAWDVQTAAGPLWLWLLGVSALLSIVILATTNNAAPPKYDLLFTIVGMVMSIVWIYFIANELVALLQAAGIVIGISNGILGVTVLAWGNSVGDMIANVVVSKSGQPQMAIAACFAAPMTNMMMGLGVATTIKIIKQGLQPYVIQSDDLKNNLFIAFIFVALCQLLTMIVVPLSKFRFTKIYGAVQILIYVGFAAVSVLSEIKLIFGSVEIWSLWQPF